MVKARSREKQRGDKCQVVPVAMPFSLGGRVSSLILGPWWSALQRWRSPLVPILATSSTAPPRSSPAIVSMLDHVLRMAVPKKRSSHTRSRTRRVNDLKARGPYLQQQHIYTCPVCERMRLPHRVCGREDCQSYFKRALPGSERMNNCMPSRRLRNVCCLFATADRWF